MRSPGLRRRASRAVVVFLFACAPASPPDGEAAEEAYVPPPDLAWETRRPAELGMDPERLQDAVDYTLAHETDLPEEPGPWLRERFAGIPHQEIVGPTKPRGEVNGIVLKDGYIVAEWGDTERVDMTFSVTKSYLSTTAGLALADGRIRSVEDRVAPYAPDSLFADEHDAPITWRHLLTQTSEWTGTLFGKPDVADRREGVDREIREPGTFWEYNDVRVNLLAYSLLHVWRRPLPKVLRERVMEPIGASTTWRWHGYRTSWVDLDGLRMQSVSGGGHWGGGLFISTRDHARFGLLFLREGLWGDERIFPASWVERATTPSEVQADYGFMWWLNTNRELFPAAPESSFFALGAGSTNVIWVDPEHDIVTVTRWVDGREHMNEFIRRVLDSVEE